MGDILREASKVAAHAEVRGLLLDYVKEIMPKLPFDRMQYSALTREMLMACVTCLSAMDVFWDYYADELISLEDIIRWSDEQTILSKEEIRDLFLFLHDDLRDEILTSREEEQGEKR